MQAALIRRLFPTALLPSLGANERRTDQPPVGTTANVPEGADQSNRTRSNHAPIRESRRPMLDFEPEHLTHCPANEHAITCLHGGAARAVVRQMMPMRAIHAIWHCRRRLPGLPLGPLTHSPPTRVAVQISTHMRHEILTEQQRRPGRSSPEATRSCTGAAPAESTSGGNKGRGISHQLHKVLDQTKKQRLFAVALTLSMSCGRRIASHAADHAGVGAPTVCSNAPLECTSQSTACTRG